MPKFLPLIFLSCLFGSELRPWAKPGSWLFLSCLFGSEPVAAAVALAHDFLSCLFGSERASGAPGRPGRLSELPIRQ